jgi:TonB family protein
MNIARILVRCLAVLAIGRTVTAAGITPVRIVQTVEPQFPAALAFSPLTSGEARVIILVEADGRLADLLVSGYTDKAFADEAVRALRRWTFGPARKEGEPIGVRLELRFDFSTTGRVVSLTPVDIPEVLIRSFVPPTLVTRVCQARELDHPLATLETVDPSHPGGTPPAPGQTGSTLIDFYVDEQGQARMPVVLKTTHETYAQAAVGALNQWRFAAPTRGGRPVAVRVRQQFVFAGDS